MLTGVEVLKGSAYVLPSLRGEVQRDGEAIPRKGAVAVFLFSTAYGLHSHPETNFSLLLEIISWRQARERVTLHLPSSCCGALHYERPWNPLPATGARPRDAEQCQQCGVKASLSAAHAELFKRFKSAGSQDDELLLAAEDKLTYWLTEQSTAGVFERTLFAQLMVEHVVLFSELFEAAMAPTQTWKWQTINRGYPPQQVITSDFRCELQALAEEIFAMSVERFDAPSTLA